MQQLAGLFDRHWEATPSWWDHRVQRSLVDRHPGQATADGHRACDERYTRRVGHMDIDITIDDPKAYAKPWHAKVPVNLLMIPIDRNVRKRKDIHLMDRSSKPIDGRR